MEHIKNKAIRLIDYLTELALLRSKIVRDISAYQSVLWLHEIPQELEYCFTQAWGTNEEFDEILDCPPQWPRAEVGICTLLDEKRLGIIGQR